MAQVRRRTEGQRQPPSQPATRGATPPAHSAVVCAADTLTRLYLSGMPQESKVFGGSFCSSKHQGLDVLLFATPPAIPLSPARRCWARPSEPLSYSPSFLCAGALAGCRERTVRRASPSRPARGFPNKPAILKGALKRHPFNQHSQLTKDKANADSTRSSSTCGSKTKASFWLLPRVGGRAQLCSARLGPARPAHRTQR